MSTNRELCFVIMPFSQTTNEHTEEYWTKHFEDFLKPLIEVSPKLEARRSQALRGDVLKQIITDLAVSPVVVADLTDNNPNVYWELGVRQSFKHGTVTVAEEGTQLPFDISAKGTLFYYPGNHLKMESFRILFKKAIQDCLEHPDRPDSHVLETISGRGTLFEIFRRDEAIRRLDAVLSECDINLKVLGWAVKRAQDNQKTPSKRKFATGLFRTLAAELLLVNRYLDEDRSFYKLTEKYLREITSVNNQITIWEFNPDSTEKWLLEVETPTAETLKEFKARVVVAREKISKIL